MPIYRKSAVVSKIGVNYTRCIIEGAGCLFQQIDQENDLGVDAICELVNADGHPENHLFALQIKSGDSYFNETSTSCSFSIGTHREYWAKYKVPVYAIVYVPKLSTAYWVDVKQFLKNNPDTSTVSFSINRANQFDEEKFLAYFKPMVAGRGPNISLEESLSLARSHNEDEVCLGLTTLFRRFPNTLQTWDELVRVFKIREASEIPGFLIYILAHIPWHGDIAYHGEDIEPSTKKYASELIDTFNEADIRKLLLMIDDDGIQRGSVGQSIEAVINSIGCAPSYLINIINNVDDSMNLREAAAFILAVDKGVEALPYLRELASGGSDICDLIIQDVIEQDGFYPYS
ncbi:MULTISPECIES: DUF4365 domain-containing protein [Gammaproteobacteria]|uniref:DUF4365 domain-containing protein n=1 Tax=Gammaproteobacteria TaxID=1236 RepID=UPI000878F8A6|nr:MULTISPECIES: DUF4365 domain-containing protein [Gammaproteobacteria]AOW83884.1 hypothetical protein VM_14920 [Vibrio mimicus]TVP13866.1 hypothetical protein AYI87_11515 [Shewanella sp. KCT]